MKKTKKGREHSDDFIADPDEKNTIRCIHEIPEPEHSSPHAFSEACLYFVSILVCEHDVLKQHAIHAHGFWPAARSATKGDFKRRSMKSLGDQADQHLSSS